MNNKLKLREEFLLNYRKELKNETNLNNFEYIKNEHEKYINDFDSWPRELKDIFTEKFKDFEKNKIIEIENILIESDFFDSKTKTFVIFEWSFGGEKKAMGDAIDKMIIFYLLAKKFNLKICEKFLLIGVKELRNKSGYYDGKFWSNYKADEYYSDFNNYVFKEIEFNFESLEEELKKYLLLNRYSPKLINLRTRLNYKPIDFENFKIENLIDGFKILLKKYEGIQNFINKDKNKMIEQLA